MTRHEAIAIGIKRYMGLMCDEHPDLGGERLTANGYCYGCHLQKRRARREADPDSHRVKSRRRQRTEKYRSKRRERDLRPEGRARKRERRRLPHVRARQSARHSKRLREDINYRLKVRLRIKVHQALRGRLKSARTFELVGCSLPHLKKYLGQKFTEGMSWANYGEWHIDHIRPCASFDLSRPSQQRACFHYSNLQPLWGSDNLAKNSHWQGVRWCHRRRKSLKEKAAQEH